MDAGLDDAHAHGVDLFDAIKQGASAEGVVHELWVAHWADGHALPELEVDDMQDAVADHQAVACAEATGDPLFHMDFLLDEYAWAVEVQPPL